MPLSLDVLAPPRLAAAALSLFSIVAGVSGTGQPAGKGCPDCLERDDSRLPSWASLQPR